MARGHLFFEGSNVSGRVSVKEIPPWGPNTSYEGRGENNENKAMLNIIVFAVFAADILGVDTIYQIAVMIKELDGPDAITTIPKAVVAFGAVGRFVVHKEHVFLFAGDIRDHPS